MEEKKIKRKINWWLEDTDFLHLTNFDYIYYLETLCKHISNLIKNIPIPVLTSYDPKNKAIYFSVGSNKERILLDTNIAYFDYLTLVKRYLYQFFPKYEIDYEIERALTEDEIVELIKEKKNKNEKIDYNDILLIKKKEILHEAGIIEKITMMKDEFVLNINSKRQIRMSGTTSMPMSLSTFMDKLKVISNDQKKYNFIFTNSEFVKELREDVQDINITYSGKQMINFFTINFKDLRMFPLEKIDNFLYKWNKFKIKFESISLRDDCLKIYEKAKEK
jgi:hypothetical protein